jgi:branched-chain amino acid transport system permease protein
MSDSLSGFLQQIVNGLSQGSIYALIALGYTMVYGVLRFINFAHGDVFMVGAFSGMYLHRWMAPSPGVAGTLAVLAGSMILCAALGVIIEKLAYRPLRDRPRLIVLITAIGVSLFLEYTAQLIFGPNRQPFPDLIQTRLLHDVGGLAIRNTQVVVLTITILLLIGLTFVVMKTRVGLAMRALSFNPTAAALMGVNTDVVISFTFALGSALAAAGGVFSCLIFPLVQHFMGVTVGLKAFVAAVLGGIGNIPGAALGGLIIGVVETMVVAYSSEIGISSGYRDAVAFVILILILLFKPSGLLGRAEREKV